MSKQHWTAALIAAGIIMAQPARTQPVLSAKTAKPANPVEATADSAAAKSGAPSAQPVKAVKADADSASAEESAAPTSEEPMAPATNAAAPGPAANTARAAATATAPKATETARGPMTQRIADWEKNELGISVSGKASSRLLQSALSGDSARISNPTHENVAYSRADVLFRARPSNTTSGSLEFRMHQDWNNYYNEGPNPLLTRWYNYGGTINDGKIAFDVGDFKEQFSPLTLYSPGVDLLYEPEIFAARRQMAMDEWHLDGNKVPLTGLHAVYTENLGSQARLKAGLTAARLRTGGASQTSWLFWTDDVEKVTGAGYLKFNLFDALELGATHIEILDPVKTSRAVNNEYITITPTEIYEDVKVNSFNLSLDGKRFLAESPISVRLDAELAMSAYQKSYDVKDTLGLRWEQRIKQDGTPDSAQIPILDLRLVKETEIKGQALRATFHAGYAEDAKGPFSLALNATYLKNDADYVNDLSQSPSFLGTRIFNKANHVGGFNSGYNTFDALYDHVYTVDPVTNINTSEFWFQDTKVYNGTNNWYRASQFKNSYTNQISTKSERDFLTRAGGSDEHVQLLYPFGPATPNRVGVDADLTGAALAGKLQATILFASLKEVKGVLPDSGAALAIATFGRVGGGVKLDAGEWINRRLMVSASFVQDTYTRPVSTDPSYAALDFKSAMINAGVSAGIWKGLSALVGFQQIKSNPPDRNDGLALVKTSGAFDLTQTNWSAGLECRIAPGAYVTGEYGMIAYDEAKTATKYSQAISSLGLIVGF